MKQKYIDYFKDLYTFCNDKNTRSCHIDFDEDKSHDLDCLDYLDSAGYIDIIAAAMGFYEVEITPDGLDFAENGFINQPPLPAIQGNNNIYVNGTNNTVSNNYNEICNQITSSELPDEYKELIETLLYEIKNPKLSSDKKKVKVRDFISSISDNVLTATASEALTILITTLLSKISF